VDIGSLCLLLDCLCGVLALSSAYQTRKLHNVIIPRRWLHSLWGDFNKFKDPPNQSHKIVAEVVQQLLEQTRVGDFVPGVLSLLVFR